MIVLMRIPSFEQLHLCLVNVEDWVVVEYAVTSTETTFTELQRHERITVKASGCLHVISPGASESKPGVILGTSQEEYNLIA